jgi:hypothetical protein
MSSCHNSTNSHNLSISWLTDYYDDVCICNDNYWGAACEFCAPGWSGDDCSIASSLNVRRNVQDLTDDERNRVVYAFTLTRTTPHPYWTNVSIWEWAMALHYYAFLPFGESIDIDFAHNGPSLAHWHRGMLSCSVCIHDLTMLSTINE